MMTPSQIDNLRDSFRAIAPHADDLAEQFFETLLRESHSSDPCSQPITGSAPATSSAASPPAQAPAPHRHHRAPLAELGAQGPARGVSPHHYGRARQAMIETSATFSAATTGRWGWSDDLERDWTQALNAASSLVLLGARPRLLQGGVRRTHQGKRHLVIKGRAKHGSLSCFPLIP